MIRIWLLAAGLVLGAAFPRRGSRRKTRCGAEHHDDAAVKLSERQMDAGKFAVSEVRGGVLSKRITVPGSIVPSGDHIARVAVRLVGHGRRTCANGWVIPSQAGEVVAVIESREVADAKSEYLAARLVFDLQQTLFNRSTRLFEGKVLSENDYLRARTTFEDARVKIETARQKLFALSLTAEQIEALPQQPVETLRRQELRAPIAGRSPNAASNSARWSAAKARRANCLSSSISSVVWADLAVPADRLDHIHEGQEITITAGRAANLRRPPSCSSARCSTRTRARPVSWPRSTTRPAKWRPGAFVTAEIPTDEDTSRAWSCR